MSDVRKFPNGGFDIVVLKKQDVLDSIDDNIIDKEIAFAIIEQCELQAAEYISQGRWTGLPYIGNVRVPKFKQFEQDAVQQALIQEAKDNLSTEDYIMFRKKLTVDNMVRAKNQRYFNYIVSCAVGKNRDLYKFLVKTKGESYAKIFLFASAHITSTDNEYVNLEEDD